ncbi:MAG: sensor histidine kinase [Oscillospiraceae bacterium]|nr:sensor histidine kinase [Oscillospiraceae bacterium]
MTLLSVLEIFNYGLVLVYGLLISVDIAGGRENEHEKRLVYVLCPALIAIQGTLFFSLGAVTVEKMYPLITHLPIFLALTFLLKKPMGVSVVSICAAYLCCQLPHSVELIVTELTHFPIAGEIAYALSAIPFFLILRRFFVKAAHDAATYSHQSLILFGSLPMAYYIFDYATSVYSDMLYAGNAILHEFLPTALIMFYVMFLSAYYVMAQKRMQTDLQSTVLEGQLRQARMEIESLSSAHTQVAIYHHDMRHHLLALEGFLSSNKTQQAREYIEMIRSDLDSFTPVRYCENGLVNLLCSSFADKAKKLKAKFDVSVSLPDSLPISDTEICSIISNGLENAFNAISSLEEERRTVSFYCGIRRNKLLIEIKNPYSGKVTMHDGLPVSDNIGHGYGCRSIRTIAERKKGLCSFETENDTFILRVVLPMQTA